MIPNNRDERSRGENSKDAQDTNGHHGNEEKKQVTTTYVPTYKPLLSFTATTIVIWLSESVLSLVDTTIIGMRSSPSKVSTLVELAALGPATTLYDSEVYVTYFLALATTNRLAPLFAKKKW